MKKNNRKITILTTLAAVIIGARVIYACNITNGGPCHTATSTTYDRHCPLTEWTTSDGIPETIVVDTITTVTDTTSDGNRIISCGTADTGLDGTTTGSTTCSYDEHMSYCKSYTDIFGGTDYLGCAEKDDTVSSPATYCGASGNPCPGG